MELGNEDFLKEREKIEKLPDAKQKLYYTRWLKEHAEKSAARVWVILNYAGILYREGRFRQVMEVLMPVIMNYHAYPYCEELITCFNQMGLAVNCEAEYDLARHFFQLALEIAEEHQVTSVYAKQHNNIGLTYYDQFHLDDAIREYQLGEAWISDSSIKEIIGPMLYGNWANALLRQERWADALEVYHKSLKYLPEDTPEDIDTLSLGMIIYYKLGMKKEYLECKQKYLRLMQGRKPDFIIDYLFLEHGIDSEDEAFVAEIGRNLENFIQENPGSESWKQKCVVAELMYDKAQKEGNLAGMQEALKQKTSFQAMGLETLEQKRLDALNEYIDICEEKQQALEKAETATRAKTQFLSNMSHDIRTPMNAIFGITQLMEHDRNDPEKMEDHIQKLKASSQHLLSLINDVLDMSKIESTEVTLNREPINLAEQVAQIKSIVYPQTEDRSQEFKIRVAGIRHENLLGDAVRLRQILINLLSNAVKYTPNGGRITLEIREKYSGEKNSTVMEFAVSDTGYGMSREFTKHIFEPFTRAENSITNKIQGTGLGMAITRSIVDLMGGTITIKSEPGKGSCFTVAVPMEIDEKTEIPIFAKQILLVAREKSLIRNLTAGLKNAGVLTYAAEDVDEAEAFLAEHTADVVLLSGNYTGKQLTASVKRIRETAPEADLVFCIDYGQEELTYEVLKDCGIQKFITRPVFMTELAAVLWQSAGDAADGQVLINDTVLKGMKFLCAEDNKLNAEILAAILEMEGASCTIFPDGKQLVEQFETVKAGEYDAILMDMQMPVMNGLDAARAIRHGRNPLGRTIPIIAMTANAFSSDIQDCLSVGMDAHLPKPLDIKALKQTVSSVMGRDSLGGADGNAP